MEKESIYNFDNYLQFLNQATTRYSSRRSRPYTLKQWAQKLGYRSPRTFSMVLRGDRFPSQIMLKNLSYLLSLNLKEARYLELLTLTSRQIKRGKPVDHLIKELREIVPTHHARKNVSLDQFTYIADWYHLVIKQVVSARNFVEDYNLIVKKLRKKVSEEDIKKALAIMLNLKIISRDDKTKKLAVNDKHIFIGEDLPSQAIRLHHSQMMDRAKEALSEQSVGNREMASLTIRMSKSHINEIKKEIRAFRDFIETRFSSEDAEDIFQLNVQFFSHTD